MKDATNTVAQNIDSSDINHWTIEKCKNFLKNYNAHYTGNIQMLKDYCFLLSKLIENNLHELFSLSIAELKVKYRDFYLGTISRD